jgi:CTP synthase (UTP-ammonia lyase)
LTGVEGNTTIRTGTCPLAPTDDFTQRSFKETSLFKNTLIAFVYTSSEVHSRHRQKIKVGRNRAANIDLRQNLSRQLDDEGTVTVVADTREGFVHVCTFSSK